MATIFFDTHNYMKRLVTSGISIDQAEAHAEALAEAMHRELVRKNDLSEFRTEVQAQFDIVKWMVGFMFVLVAAAAVLFKLSR